MKCWLTDRLKALEKKIAQASFFKIYFPEEATILSQNCQIVTFVQFLLAALFDNSLYFSETVDILEKTTTVHQLYIMYARFEVKLIRDQ